MPPIPLILDTDIGTDVDDALALAFALRHPQIDLRAVTTVSGDTVRRAKIARKLLRLAGRDDIEVAAGERGEQTQAHRSAEAGHEDQMLDSDDPTLAPTGRDGVTLLCEELVRGDTNLATVGMQSNLAAAVQRDPSLPERVPLLAVMGGVFAPVESLGRRLSPDIDHNLDVDQPASIVALNAGFRTLYTPCDVTMGTWLEAAHVDRLRKGDALCRELARQIDIYTASLRREFGSGFPANLACLLHDPLAVAVIVDREHVTTITAPVTVARHGDHVRTFIDPLEGKEAEIVASVDTPAFARFWLETVLR